MAKSISKKMVALLLMAVMVMTMSMTAFASTETKNVKIYKSDMSELSMANDILADGTAEVVTDDNDVTVTIPIVPLLNYHKLWYYADGYLQTVSVNGGSGVVNPTSSFPEGDNRYGCPYKTANLVITLNSMPSNNHIVVDDSYIKLYKAGYNTQYTTLTHVTPSFVIVLE